MSVQANAVEDAGTAQALGLDEVFEILKNQRRRHVLQYLRETGDPVSLSDLSEQIAAWENDKEPRQISSSERKRVYVGLYQCHLPKMDSMDIVDFNKPRGIIEPGENIERFYVYLDVAAGESERNWSGYYAGFSTIAVVAFLGAFLLETIMPLPAIAVATGIVLGGFAVTVVYQHRSDRAGPDRTIETKPSQPVFASGD